MSISMPITTKETPLSFDKLLIGSAVAVTGACCTSLVPVKLVLLV
jgi:hypothetical protein